MTDYNDGKIHGWNGGDCPVHPKTEVKYWLRCGEVHAATADDCVWEHVLGQRDIIAFCVTKAHVEPDTVWLVRMEYGTYYLAKDEADAWRFAGVEPENRTVVKYQEVPL